MVENTDFMQATAYEDRSDFWKQKLRNSYAFILFFVLMNKILQKSTKHISPEPAFNLDHESNVDFN